MAIRPEDLALDPTQLNMLLDFQRHVSQALKQFGCATLVTERHHRKKPGDQILITYPYHISDAAASAAVAIFRQLGWDITIVAQTESSVRCAITR